MVDQRGQVIDHSKSVQECWIVYQPWCSAVAEKVKAVMRVKLRAVRAAMRLRPREERMHRRPTCLVL